MRCAKCKHSWHQEPPDDLPNAADLAPPPMEPTPIPKGSNLPAVRRPRRQSSPLTGWAVLVTIVILVVGGFYMAREKVVEIWPHAERLFAATDSLFGTSAPIGIDIQNVKGKFLTEKGTVVLVMKGDLKNISKSPKPIPRIRINLLNKKNENIFYWTFSVNQQTLAPGQSVPFSSRLPNPPSDMTNAVATFDIQSDGKVKNN